MSEQTIVDLGDTTALYPIMSSFMNKEEIIEYVEKQVALNNTALLELIKKIQAHEATIADRDSTIGLLNSVLQESEKNVKTLQNDVKNKLTLMEYMTETMKKADEGFSLLNGKYQAEIVLRRKWRAKAILLLLLNLVGCFFIFTH